MALVNLVQTFERFLKEVAARCVDCLLAYVVDDRFNIFKIQGSSLASHFAAESAGDSLCESATWLDCEEINDRFRRLLSEPFQVGGSFFYLFPKQNQLAAGQVSRFDTMNLEKGPLFSSYPDSRFSCPRSSRMESKESPKLEHDSSTNALIRRYRA